ncbi:uncharacterized protein LOC130629471 [Hydractinia symbiolongicarpus]|uniref:uncharacterized protein LOC130629471 n=1 Tax=Hydractinia symbiolongicarpus TaxID=13093 RepID=UPI00254FD089|nr:uncharacterized protein LOC130629471 [Hydractinia symbiolongicarpus]
MDRMEGDVGPARSPNEHERFGPLLLREFDENPGEKAFDKSVAFGIRGAAVGVLVGGTYAAMFEPASKVNGITYALRHMGKAAVFGGAYGALLGAGIPIAQAIRKKNDPVAWMWGGFAAGTVFALKSGRPTTGLQVGVLTGLVMGIAKLTEGYKEPYPDRLKYLRKPPPKTYKLFDEEGNMITHTRL